MKAIDAATVAAGAVMVAAAAAGLAWGDCLLIASAALAMQRLGLLHIGRAGAQQPWRVALRCLQAGACGLVAASLMAGVALTALLGLWPVDHPHPDLAVGLLAGCGALLALAHGKCPTAWRETGLWAAAVVVVALGYELDRRGWTVAPCLIVLAAAAWTGRGSWRVAHDGSRALFMADPR